MTDTVISPLLDDEDLEEEVQQDPHMALYRKYRPKKFSEMVGQELQVKALSKSVATQRLTHAYLFSGDRGCGKTTAARIFAAALNCQFRKDGDPEPCAECDDCVSILNGDHMSLFYEINSAQNRGVEAMEDILSQVDMGIPSGRWKVYLFDEVHQITNHASNSLLKTLEEPNNDRVIFILATTDPDKLLPTIQSRTTRLNFPLISDDKLYSLAEKINDAEKLSLTTQQLRNAVYGGRGSARDMISTLEAESLGLESSSDETRQEVLLHVASGDLAEALISIAQADVSETGATPSKIIAESLLELYRNSLLYQRNPALLKLSDADMRPVRVLAQRRTSAQIARGFQLVGDGLRTMRASGTNRIILEGVIGQLMIPGARSQNEGIIDQLDDLKDMVADLADTVSKMSSGAIAPAGNVSTDWPRSVQDENTDDVSLLEVSQNESDPEPEPEPAPEKKAEKPRRERRSEKQKDEQSPTEADADASAEIAASELDDQFTQVWDDILSEARPRIKTLLQSAEIALKGDTLEISTPRPVPANTQETLEEKLHQYNIEYSTNR